MKELIEHIKQRFIEEFSSEPILVASPGRINLIGGHTDYNQGFVLPAAIDKYVFLAIQRSEKDHSTLISFDKNERFECKVEELQPIEKGGWRNYLTGVIAETQKLCGPLDNVNVIFGGTIPEGAGLSSSAGIENSLAFGLNELFDLKLSALTMAKISQKAEHNFVGVKCGIMDQYTSMLGVEDHLLFLDCRSVTSELIKFGNSDIEFLVVNSNVKHTLAEAAYNDRRESCERVAKTLNKKALRDLSLMELERERSKLSPDDYRKALFIVEENMRVRKAVQSIQKGNYDQLGRYLFEAHQGAKELYEISCPELDYLISSAAKDPAAIGARIMGGGFGGCTVNMVYKNQSEAFQDRLKASYEAKFQKPCTIYKIKFSKGTHRIEL